MRQRLLTAGMALMGCVALPAHAQWDQAESERAEQRKESGWVFTGEGQIGGGPTKQAFANAAGYGIAPFSVRISFGTSFCSGALIHPKYVLTAAHCVEDHLATLEDWTVLAGANSLSAFGQVLTANSVFFHPDWDGDGFDQSDLAIVELDSLASPSALRPNVEPLTTGTSLRLFGWGLDENGTDPGIQQWGDYTVSGAIWDGQTRMLANGTAGPCGGDSGAPYVAFDGSGRLRIMAIHSSSNNATCGLANEWGAVRLDLPANQDFILSVVGNVYDLQYYAHSWRNANYALNPVNSAWVGHALQWKAYRSGHAYNPPFVMPSPAIHCPSEPGAIVDDLEVTQFNPADPPGSWGCWPTDDAPSLYLAAAYSMFRWNSPAYVQAIDGSTLALTRLTFEVRDEDGDSVPLWFACGWEPDGSPMTAQAAADSCDTFNYDITLHAVDAYRWSDNTTRLVMCADDFEDAFVPGLDIVFDPPTGVALSSTPARSMGRYRASERPRRQRMRLPPPSEGPLETLRAEQQSLDAVPAPPGAAGFFFGGSCTEP